MIKELINLASHLDAKGYTKEADYLDNIIKRAQDGAPAQLAPAPSQLTPVEEKMKDGITGFVDYMLERPEKIRQLHDEFSGYPDSQYYLHVEQPDEQPDEQLEEYPVSLP